MRARCDIWWDASLTALRNAEGDKLLAAHREGATSARGLQMRVCVAFARHGTRYSDAPQVYKVVRGDGPEVLRRTNHKVQRENCRETPYGEGVAR